MVAANTSALTHFPISFHIEARRRYVVRDVREHEISFGVVGVDKPAITVITHEGGREVKIVDRVERGTLDLPDALLDSLAINCFCLIYDMIVEHDGQSGWWTVSDITPLIRKTIPEPGADRVLKELSRHVKPGMKVQSA